MEPIIAAESASIPTEAPSKVRSSYRELLVPIDIFAPPPGTKKLLSLNEMYKFVKSQGVSLKVANEDLSSAKETQTTAKRRFLPKLDLDLGHTQSWTKTKSDSDPTDSFLDRDHSSGARSIGSTAGLTLGGTPFDGVSYTIKTPNLTHQQRQPDESPSQPSRPDQGSASIGVTLALLKDNPLLVEKSKDRKRDLEWSRAKVTFRSATLKSIADAERSYYDLIQRYLSYVIQERSLKLARALRDDITEMIAAGESSKVDSMRADLQVAQAETDFLANQIEYEAAIDSFRSSLSLDEVSGEGYFPDPSVLKRDLPVLEKEVANAMALIRKGNPEMLFAKIQKQTAEIDLELSRKATLPSLGLTTSYSNTAPADGWDRATAEAYKPNDRNFSVGLEFRYTLYNDGQQDLVSQAAVARQKAEYSADQTEQLLFKNLSSLLKKLDIGQRRLKIAQLSREMAEKNLQAEYEKFKVGESSVRAVIDSQSELNSARTSELGARIDLLSGFGDLRAMGGRLPEGISMDYRALKSDYKK